MDLLRTSNRAQKLQFANQPTFIVTVLQSITILYVILFCFSPATACAMFVATTRRLWVQAARHRPLTTSNKRALLDKPETPRGFGRFLRGQNNPTGGSQGAVVDVSNLGPYNLLIVSSASGRRPQASSRAGATRER
jgi:hypothetical protein